MSDSEKRDVRFIRLINGDDVLAEVKKQEGVHVLVKPIQVMLNKQSVNQEIMMIAWLPINSSDADEVTLRDDHVLFTVPLNEKVSKRLETYMDQIYCHPDNAATPAEADAEAQKTLEQISGLIKGKKLN